MQIRCKIKRKEKREKRNTKHIEIQIINNKQHMRKGLHFSLLFLYCVFLIHMQKKLKFNA